MSMVASRLGALRNWLSKSTFGTARWQRTTAAVASALIFAALAPTDAAVGLDPSWEAATALAQNHHLAWGTEIVFTSGPLGFLANSTYYYFGQAVAACIYQVVVLSALFLGIAAALRQRVATTMSLVGAFVVTGITSLLLVPMYPDLAVLAALIWASVLLFQGDDAERSSAFAMCCTLGAAAGFQFLVKINSGPTILLIALATSVLLNWRAIGRHLGTVVAFGISIVACWTLTDQPLNNLPTWLRRSGALASGYVDAMAVPLSIYAAPAVVLTVVWVIILCVTFLRDGSEISRRFVLLAGLATLISAKTAYGRFDYGHVYILLSLIIVTVAIAPRWSARQQMIAIAVVTAFAVFLGGIPFVTDRGSAAALAPMRAVTRLLTLATPGQTQRQIEQAQARQRANYAVPAQFIQSMGSGTVHIDPIDTSVAWSYSIGWHPVPVFQTYAAFTPALDTLNSESLTNGPQFVLSRVSPVTPARGIDGRLAIQESPSYDRTLLCDYALDGVEDRWALFARSAPRCGPLTALSEVTVRDHDVITVPAPPETGRGGAGGNRLASNGV
ncbi:hypothetical protein MSAS_02950 [Mycobacterium saskatchewanense]|uniref:Uncharacterized protein n=2 Tax=Mycobacterium saskatchewanense TaxID=220927 RepID=A0AAJ3TY99_9MYCO|nr:hypothetical protein AWC23_02850 [Mycobacterium saskatchewanense]BBX61121.1 hypothetical protein MSAS_02950 [Mycobacterium saskatchewanense]